MIERLQGRAPVCVAALALCMVVAAPVSAQHAADRIWSGGPILTMNDKAMRAEAVAEKDGKIVAVGGAASVMKLKGPETQLIDLKGRTLLPGFVDAHGHMMGGGLQALSANLLAPPDGKVHDMASLQQTLRDWMADERRGGREGQPDHRLRLRQLAALAELRHPTRDDLDAVSQRHPHPARPPVRRTSAPSTPRRWRSAASTPTRQTRRAA